MDDDVGKIGEGDESSSGENSIGEDDVFAMYYHETTVVRGF